MLIILDCKLKRLFCKCFRPELYSYHHQKLINQEICIVSPPSHIGLFSYVYFQVLYV